MSGPAERAGATRRALRADAFAAIVFLVVAATYLLLDARLPTARIGDPLGPKAFPALVGGGLVLSALLLLLETRRNRRALGAVVADRRPATDRWVVLLLAGMVAWSALYYACFELLGYLIATPLFILGLLACFNRRRPGLNLAVAIGFTIVVYLLFSVGLGVPLPTGPLPI
jgi:putative tricarboxylic transport membrane protein